MRTAAVIMMCALLGASGLVVRAQEIDTNTADFNFVQVPASKVLDVYQKITGAELVFLNDVPEQNRWITLHVVVLRNEVSEKVPKRIEQALLKQANISLTSVDEKQVSVEYGKYDIMSDARKTEQGVPLVICLTAADVQTNTVRVISQRSNPTPNLIFRFAYKSSEEIEALACGRPTHRVQIVKDGRVIAESSDYAGYLAHGGEKYIGLDLLFTNYDEAKLAESVLRGN